MNIWKGVPYHTRVCGECWVGIMDLRILEPRAKWLSELLKNFIFSNSSKYSCLARTWIILLKPKHAYTDHNKEVIYSLIHLLSLITSSQLIGKSTYTSKAFLSSL